MYENLPSWLKPNTIANNRQQIKMVNGSKITCVTEGNKDLSRGATNTIVHLSEFAFWKNPQKQLTAITKSLVANGKIIIESTAQGLNYFNELYFKSKNGENDYRSFFFNWIDGRELFEIDYKLAVERYKARHNGNMLSMEDLNEEEKQLIKLGATLDQLVFRRSEIEQDGLDKFHEERPSTDIEAFISSGANVFDNARINSVETSLINDKVTHIPKDNIINLPVLLQNHYGRSFFIYKVPVPKERYYIGCDLSEGVGGDYSVIEVLDRSGEQVAEFYNNKLKPFEMAEIINAIGLYYNKGLITVEKASGGHSAIERLRYDYRYMNMTKYKTYDEFQRPQWAVGFDTNTKTKSIIINDFVEAFSKGVLKINSRRLLQEMKVFSINDNGSMSASGSNHDDTVMSTALAIVSLKNPYYYSF